MKCKICGKEFDEEHYMKPYQDICSSKCFKTDFWNNIVNRKDNFIFINGASYQIGDENDTSSFRGYAGRKFVIEKDNGEIITTTNLWHQGNIPVNFKDKLKDNAKFLEG